MATTSSLGGSLAKTLWGLTPPLNIPVAAAAPEYFKKSLLLIPFFDFIPIFHSSFGG
jgi:hypothetical protein